MSDKKLSATLSCGYSYGCKNKTYNEYSTVCKNCKEIEFKKMITKDELIAITEYHKNKFKRSFIDLEECLIRDAKLGLNYTTVDIYDIEVLEDIKKFLTENAFEYTVEHFTKSANYYKPCQTIAYRLTVFW